MKQQVRLRMAPSPTGEYHIGHIRTILYNFAFAKKHNGKFIIRIEDTDRTRYVEGAIDRIMDVITDYGFTWDEGPRVGGDFGPYIQSERLFLYKKYAMELVEKGAAYYCFCTSERLTAMREEQQRKGIIAAKYDKHCLALSKEEIKKNLDEKMPHVIRLNVLPNKNISFTDVVFGEITVNSNDIDDQILLKSDGFPTYHLGVVVDDHLMEITHVMRGNDWIPSTPKHILLYNAFGWELPTFIHLPNLKELGATKKLSKRFGPVSAREFLDAGYLPEALINFLMFLGWNPGTEKEVYTLDAFIADFDVRKIHNTDLVSFDRQKLEWLNGYYISHMDDTHLLSKLKEYYKNDTEVMQVLSSEHALPLLTLAKTRMKKLSELKDLVVWTSATLSTEEKDIAAHFKTKLEEVEEWKKEEILRVIREMIVNEKIKGNLLYTIISGRPQGLPLPETLELFGKEKTLEKLEEVVC